MDSFVSDLQIQSVPAYIITSSRAFPQVLEILQLFLACLLRITLYSAWSYCCNETSVSVVYIITTIITDKLARKRRFPKSALAVIVKSETSSHNQLWKIVITEVFVYWKLWQETIMPFKHKWHPTGGRYSFLGSSFYNMIMLSIWLMCSLSYHTEEG